MFIIAFLKSPDRRELVWLDERLRRRTRIRCPACKWQPGPQDRWTCDPGCGHVWNTFETRGVCPGCDKQWTHTACLRCQVWSPHESWYEEEDDPPAR